MVSFVSLLLVLPSDAAHIYIALVLEFIYFVFFYSFVLFFFPFRGWKNIELIIGLDADGTNEHGHIQPQWRRWMNEWKGGKKNYEWAFFLCVRSLRVRCCARVCMCVCEMTLYDRKTVNACGKMKHTHTHSPRKGEKKNISHFEQY